MFRGEQHERVITGSTPVSGLGNFGRGTLGSLGEGNYKLIFKRPTLDLCKLRLCMIHAASLRSFTRLFARPKIPTLRYDTPTVLIPQRSALTRTPSLWRTCSFTSQPEASKDPNALHLACTVFHGSERKSINEQFSKSHLCSQHGLQPRDIRQIDSTVPNARATILAREQCILVNILKLRVLIKRDCVWLIHAGEEEFQDETGARERFINELQVSLPVRFFEAS